MHIDTNIFITANPLSRSSNLYIYIHTRIHLYIHMYIGYGYRCRYILPQTQSTAVLTPGSLEYQRQTPVGHPPVSRTHPYSEEQVNVQRICSDKYVYTCRGAGVCAENLFS